MITDVTSEEITVHGHCDQHFSSLKEVFADNFRNRGGVGASFAVTIDGKFVIDIWAVYADAGRTRPWTRDTLACLYSTTKAMTALCALMLVDRGQLDLDAPVARYWPEKEMPFGPNPRTLFMGGGGGSAVVVDHDARLSLAYVMNNCIGAAIEGDNRALSLGRALYAVL